MKKNLVLLAVLTIVGLLGWGVFSYLTTESADEPNQIERITTKPSKYDNINVKDIERRENDNRSLLNVAYPVTENSDVNEAVEKFAHTFIDEFSETAESQEQAYQDYVATTGLESHTIVTNFVQHFDVSFANDTYVSFVFDQYQNTGGTGMDNIVVKIFDRQTGKEIPLGDLFTDPAYLERLSKLSRDILIKRTIETAKTLDGTEEALAEYIERGKETITEGTKPVPENFDSLVISDDGNLTIYFDKYQVGPGSDGIVSVAIPLTEIADMLAPEVRAIFAVADPTPPPAPLPETPTTPNKPESPQFIPDKNPSARVDCDVAKCVALTFDDGPSVYTGTLLDALKQYNVSATFFVLGRSAKIQPDTIARIVAEGHELGNHTWDHKDLRTLSGADIDRQLQQTDDLVMSIVGIKPQFLRPPYGAYNDDVLTHVHRPIILWSVDPEDWKQPPATELIKRMTAPQPGAIILAHDIHQGTVAVIPQVITELLNQGFVFVTVSELLRKPIQAGAVYRHR